MDHDATKNNSKSKHLICTFRDPLRSFDQNEQIHDPILLHVLRWLQRQQLLSHSDIDHRQNNVYTIRRMHADWYAANFHNIVAVECTTDRHRSQIPCVFAVDNSHYKLHLHPRDHLELHAHGADPFVDGLWHVD